MGSHGGQRVRQPLLQSLLLVHIQETCHIISAHEPFRSVERGSDDPGQPCLLDGPTFRGEVDEVISELV